MRQLLEDQARQAGAVDPSRVAGQLLFLVEGAAAAGMDVRAAGAVEVRALADAVVVAASAR